VPQTAEGWKAEFAASVELQRDHASAETYAHWMQGVAEGPVRIIQGACLIRSGGKRRS
jgi:hypothetical protein